MDTPQPQQVEQDGEQDHQEAAREQVVVVDKGDASPVGMTGPEGLLLDVSAQGETKQQKTHKMRAEKGWLETVHR